MIRFSDLKSINFKLKINDLESLMEPSAVSIREKMLGGHEPGLS